jgi:hypothetical protein
VPSDPRLSRRSLLAGSAVGAGSLIAPPVVHAARGEPEQLFSRWVGSIEGISPTIPAGRPFALVGARWRAPSRPVLELRARLAGGRWSRWVSAACAGHGPDRPSEREGCFGEPLWAGDADAIQLRSEGRISGVRLHFVSAGSRARDAPAGMAHARAAGVPLARPTLSAGPGQPPIIARSAWAGTRARPAVPPSYGAVRMAFVHHTDGLNGYSAAQVPSIIYAIYLYHRYSNGWNDIGYNFVIDDFGRVWEARAGGIDLPVVGAQAGGYNLESTGAAILGTFTSVLPSAAALDALERLLAWKLSLHGLASGERVRVEVDPADAFYTPFSPGQVIWLPRVAGHRQGCSTDCPGNALFARLPRVRARVARLAGRPARLTISSAGSTPASYLALAGRPLVAGRSLTISGQLTSLQGSPYGGAPIELQQVLEGETRTLAVLRTAADGSWSASLTPAANMLLRAVHPQEPASVSPLLAVSVAPLLTLSVASSAPLEVSGTVTPATLRAVTLELYRAGGQAPLRRRRLAVHDGRFAARWGRVRAGRYVLVASTAASARFASASSPPLALTVS